MIVNEQFAFIHVHKTGGRTLNSVIEKCIPGSRMVGYHYPISQMPVELRHLPIVGVVRNPWDWYVSWYAFNRKMGMTNPLFIVVSDGGKADFKTTIRQLVRLGDDGAQSRAYRSALAMVLPEAFGTDRGAGLTRGCIEGFEEPNRGYYSWLFERMLGDGRTAPLHVARFENLHAEFARIMRTLGVAEADKLAAALDASERKNTSTHSHYSHYYDAELRDLIAERERGLIETYGYTFERHPPLDAPVPLPKFYSYDVGFRKLPGGERNFLRLCADFDIGSLRAAVERISDEEWAASRRAEKFHVHRHTQSITLLSDDFKHLAPTQGPTYARFANELAPVFDTIARFYGGDGIVLRALLVRLTEGEVIDPHFDIGMSLLHSHRVHVPIITHEQVQFCVGGEKRHLAAGEMWEINNATVHYVENFSRHPRVHLIVDWAPMATVTNRERIAGVVKASPPPPEEPTVSRNAPCPCGSGERYKNCHGRLA